MTKAKAVSPLSASPRQESSKDWKAPEEARGAIYKAKSLQRTFPLFSNTLR